MKTTVNRMIRNTTVKRRAPDLGARGLNILQFIAAPVLRETCHLTLGAAALAAVLLAAPAHAGLIAYDGFNYPAGSGLSTVGSGGGTGWSGAWGNNDWEVATTGLTYTNGGIYGGSSSYAASTSGGWSGVKPLPPSWSKQPAIPALPSATYSLCLAEIRLDRA